MKLETATPHGRVNLAGTTILAVFGLLYSASDVVRHLISASEDVIKSIALSQDIYHEYETPNVVLVMLPVLIGWALCLFFLWLHERSKKNISQENDTEEQE